MLGTVHIWHSCNFEYFTDSEYFLTTFFGFCNVEFFSFCFSNICMLWNSKASFISFKTVPFKTVDVRIQPFIILYSGNPVTFSGEKEWFAKNNQINGEKLNI